MLYNGKLIINAYKQAKIPENKGHDLHESCVI